MCVYIYRERESERESYTRKAHGPWTPRILHDSLHKTWLQINPIHIQLISPKPYTLQLLTKPIHPEMLRSPYTAPIGT